MYKSQYLAFYNYFGKHRKPPPEGLFGENLKNCEGANENLPFFVCDNSIVCDKDNIFTLRKCILI